jgi:hypothetical protein
MNHHSQHSDVFEDSPKMKGMAMSAKYDVRPYKIHIPDADLQDMMERLRRTRFPDDFGNENWNELFRPAGILSAATLTDATGAAGVVARGGTPARHECRRRRREEAARPRHRGRPGPAPRRHAGPGPGAGSGNVEAGARAVKHRL